MITLKELIDDPILAEQTAEEIAAGAFEQCFKKTKLTNKNLIKTEQDLLDRIDKVSKIDYTTFHKWVGENYDSLFE